MDVCLQLPAALWPSIEVWSRPACQMDARVAIPNGDETVFHECVREVSLTQIVIFLILVTTIPRYSLSAESANHWYHLQHYMQHFTSPRMEEQAHTDQKKPELSCGLADGRYFVYRNLGFCVLFMYATGVPCFSQEMSPHGTRSLVCLLHAHSDTYSFLFLRRVQVRSTTGIRIDSAQTCWRMSRNPFSFSQPSHSPAPLSPCSVFPPSLHSSLS